MEQQQPAEKKEDASLPPVAVPVNLDSRLDAQIRDESLGMMAMGGVCLSSACASCVCASALVANKVFMVTVFTKAIMVALFVMFVILFLVSLAADAKGGRGGGGPPVIIFWDGNAPSSNATSEDAVEFLFWCSSAACLASIGAYMYYFFRWEALTSLRSTNQ